ncbi:PDCD2_C domain protein [Aspergillus sp. HF37]|nr:PDCD2_C domain protein [Aspergillus sp. HF37]
MDPYDSDSSGLEDEGDYTDTGVLLGYASAEVIEDNISHLGGWPTWLDENSPPPGTFANCKVCNQSMHLLLELHGDLPEHFADHERRLYIFGCCRKTCNRKPGSIRGLRATRKVKIAQPEKPAEKEATAQGAEAEAKPKQDLGASLFGAGSLTGSVSGNANPFSSSSSADANQNQSQNPFATPAPTTSPPQPSQSNQQSDLSETFAAKVRISSSSPTSPKIPPPEAADTPQTPWPPQSAFPTPYPHLYLDAEYETLSRPSSPTVPDNVTFENADEDGKGGGGSTAELKDAFESELDKTFIRFSGRLSQNPEQVLRYEFGGEPLLYSQADETGKRLHGPGHGDAGAGAKVAVRPSGGSRMPRCEYCGSERVFELQLVPHAISVLEEGREGVGLGPKDEPGMEWGSIILGVCGRDCGPGDIGATGWREEWAAVQWEEAGK